MKQRFNNKGFLLLQQKLYQQGDEVLKIQSELIRNSFISWMSFNFELSEMQLEFFAAMDHILKLRLSLDTGFAIENRHPLRLDIYPSRDNKVKERAKQLLISHYEHGVLHLNIKVVTENQLVFSN